jgi:hypothetical protein
LGSATRCDPYWDLSSRAHRRNLGLAFPDGQARDTENYPFFAAKGIDWRQVGERGRRLVNTHTTDDELFSILCNMIVPLHDAHVALEAKGHQPCASPRPGTPDYTGDPALRQRIAEVTEQNLGVPKQNIQTWADGQISYSDLPESIGYLHVTTFQNYTHERSFAADKAELDRAMNAIFTGARVRSLRGLVIDMRVNGGGADPLGLDIAG